MFVASTVLFAAFKGKGWVFLLFFLAPDLAMFDYLANTGVGSFMDNLVHVYATSSVTIFAGLCLKSDGLLLAGVILLGHIGADRLLGFGLKYPTAFKDTRLQRV